MTRDAAPLADHRQPGRRLRGRPMSRNQRSASVADITGATITRDIGQERGLRGLDHPHRRRGDPRGAGEQRAEQPRLIKRSKRLSRLSSSATSARDSGLSCAENDGSKLRCTRFHYRARVSVEKIGGSGGGFDRRGRGAADGHGTESGHKRVSCPTAQRSEKGIGSEAMAEVPPASGFSEACPSLVGANCRRCVPRTVMFSMWVPVAATIAAAIQSLRADVKIEGS